ncbi:sulfite reductase [Simkania negevensis]|uniref:Sulfite reductase n=1 Tax=Simkania negevensis TaxID=83561 RepID=A0ABS3AUF9_9BACT|nr:sulfite reductase [Simkania negevensis]
MNRESTKSLSLDAPTRKNPFFASVVERYCLNREGQGRTYHLRLDLTGSGIEYRPGDSIAVIPSSSVEAVGRMLKLLGCDGSEIVVDNRSGEEETLQRFLEKKGNLSSPTRPLLQLICDRMSKGEKRRSIEALLADRDQFKKFIADHEVWDTLAALCELPPPFQDVCDVLTRLIPRLYSVASSRSMVGDAVDFTVVRTAYTTSDIARRGVCTHYLIDDVPQGENVVPVYLQPTRLFLLPEDSAIPIIMVGPGTGVAPFRAFMQERMAAAAKGRHWLFFGERYAASDFFYQEEWQRYIDADMLRLDTAFSRDQNAKVYVQHRMIENAKALWHWMEQGAIFYVCGDAKYMAKDVEKAMMSIIRQEGGLGEEEAAALLREWKKEKRYLTDVY